MSFICQKKGHCSCADCGAGTPRCLETHDGSTNNLASQCTSIDKVTPGLYVSFHIALLEHGLRRIRGYTEAIVMSIREYTETR